MLTASAPDGMRLQLHCLPLAAQPACEQLSTNNRHMVIILIILEMQARRELTFLEYGRQLRVQIGGCLGLL